MLDLNYIRRKHHHSDIAALCVELESARKSYEALTRLHGDIDGLRQYEEVAFRLGNILNAWDVHAWDQGGNP
jgi:hypothetical protein